MASIAVDDIRNNWRKLQIRLLHKEPRGLIREVLNFFIEHVDDLAPYSIMRHYTSTYMTYDGYDSDVPGDNDRREVSNSYVQGYDISLSLGRTLKDLSELDYNDLGPGTGYSRKDLMKKSTLEYTTTQVDTDQRYMTPEECREKFNEIFPVLTKLHNSLVPLYHTIKNVEKKCYNKSVRKSNKTIIHCYQLCADALKLMCRDDPLYHYINAEIMTKHKPWSIDM